MISLEELIDSAIDAIIEQEVTVDYRGPYNPIHKKQINVDNWADESTFGAPTEVMLSKVVMLKGAYQWGTPISDPPIFLPDFLIKSAGIQRNVANILAGLNKYIQDGYPALVKQGFRVQGNIEPLQLGIDEQGKPIQQVFRYDVASPIELLVGVRTEEGILNIADLIRVPVAVDPETLRTRTGTYLDEIRDVLLDFGDPEYGGKGFINAVEKTLPGFPKYIEVTFDEGYPERLLEIATDPNEDPDKAAKAQQQYDYLKEHPFDLVGMIETGEQRGQGFYIMNKYLDANDWEKGLEGSYDKVIERLLSGPPAPDGPIRTKIEREKQERARRGEPRETPKGRFREWLRETGQGSWMRTDKSDLVKLLVAGLSSTYMDKYINMQIPTEWKNLPILPLLVEEMLTPEEILACYLD